MSAADTDRDPDPGAEERAALLRPPRLRALRIILALALREMGSTYGRQPGGYVWAILSPLGAVLALSIAFSFLVRTPSLGTSFILFYATGYLPFDIYGQITNKTASALRYYRALLAYPGVGWLHAVLARFLLNLLTLVTVFCIVIIGIMIAVETRSILDIRPIVTGIAMAATLGLGVGMMNCFLMGNVPVWERIWPIITRPLFLVSGIFYVYEDLPRIGQDILWWNPLIHITGLVRTGFYPTYHATYVSPVYVFGIALTLVAFSMLMLGRTYRAVLER